VSTDLTAPNLRGTLPVIQTPELRLPSGSESAIAVDGQADQGPQDAAAMPLDAQASSEDAVRQDLGKVNEADDISQAAAVAVSGGEQDDQGDDDDNDEGDMPWWVWLLVVVGVVTVVSRLRGGRTHG